LTNALEGKKIPIYGDGKNIRDWIFVRDHCSALIAVLQKGHPGEVYDIAGNNEITNLELIRTLLGILEKPEDLINFVADRLVMTVVIPSVRKKLAGSWGGSRFVRLKKV
jgi:dTDP-glucose 4,6-dehydratase